MAKDNSDLSSDELFNQVEAGTLSMFNELTQPGEESAAKDKDKDSKARIKRRMKRKDRNQRKEHVGRFFVNLMEKNIRQPGIPDCLIPVLPILFRPPSAKRLTRRFQAKLTAYWNLLRRKASTMTKYWPANRGKPSRRKFYRFTIPRRVRPVKNNLKIIWMKLWWKISNPLKMARNSI